MLTRLYIQALLVDERMADQVWEAWDAREIDDCAAYFAWLLISFSSSEKSMGLANSDHSRSGTAHVAIIAVRQGAHR